MRRVLLTLLIILLIATPATAKRILFYEVGTSRTYQIEAGSSQYAEILKKEGYDVASLTKGSLTKKSLENYDILVVQDLNQDLGTQEISAILWFVLQNGKGLFINGAGRGDQANQLTIPFGVTIDDGTLVDPGSQTGSKSTGFIVSETYSQPGMGVIIHGIDEITVYEGGGFILSGDARQLLSGDNDTYSDTGSFPAGSRPPVAAASLFGEGLVFVHTDADTFSDKYIKEKDNKKYGLNIINWLAIASEDLSIVNSTEDIEVEISRLKIKREELLQNIDRLNAENDHVSGENNRLQEELFDLSTEKTVLTDGMIGPLNRNNWAIIVLGTSILIAAIIASQKRVSGEEQDDVLSELGYDLEDEGDEIDDVEGLEI